MRYKDMKQLVGILSREWNLGHKDSGAPKSLCAWLYLFEILKATDETSIYYQDGKLKGIAAYGDYSGRQHRTSKKFYDLLIKFIYLSPQIKNKDALRDYNHAYDETISVVKDNFDSELSILILDRSLRGQGIGKKLLYDIWDKAKKNGLKHMLISTDDACSVFIYDATGCRCIKKSLICEAEQNDALDPPRQYSYIYEKYL